MLEANGIEEVKEEKIYSPMNGVVKDIENSSDAAFSSKAMGDGVVITEHDGNVYSPVDKEEKIYSPMNGVVKDIENSSDAAFSSKAMGDGVVITEHDGNVYSPVDGEVVFTFPTGHACGIKSDAGADIPNRTCMRYKKRCWSRNINSLRNRHCKTRRKWI